MTFHTPGGVPYWNESAYYRFNRNQVDELEKAANDLNMMCISAAEHVIKRGLWDTMGIPLQAVSAILRSWENDDFSLYGRFDFSYDGVNPPKMLEYNADTPTSLVEAAVVQWFWLQEKFPEFDQFNSIHEKLIEAWKRLKGDGVNSVHLGGVKDSDEDFRNVQYIQDTCHQAGLETKQLYVEDLGWNEAERVFVDLDNEAVNCFFKLYPWEWMFHEEFWKHVQRDESQCQFIEPAWKALLSNKALLPILWALYPDHPNLLPAFFDQGPFSRKGSYVKKPKLSREGANIEIIDSSSGLPLKIIETAGDYGEEGYVYQALAKLPSFDGHYPVCGVWVVNHEACGLGVREDNSLVTGNLSRFVPHLFK